jgi:hypothetical protein
MLSSYTLHTLYIPYSFFLSSLIWSLHLVFDLSNAHLCVVFIYGALKDILLPSMYDANPYH